MQDGLFVEESADVQAIVRRLMAAHHYPAMPNKGIAGADPFVIALAIHGGNDWVVISDEHPGSADNRKIPYVCGVEGVQCLKFQQIMMSEGWKF